MQDRLASYPSQLSEEIEHGFCHVHLLLNLEEIAVREKAPDGWAAAGSGCFRTRAGTERFAQVRGLAVTAHKRGHLNNYQQPSNLSPCELEVHR